MCCTSLHAVYITSTSLFSLLPFHYRHHYIEQHIQMKHSWHFSSIVNVCLYNKIKTDKSIALNDFLHFKILLIDLN